MDLKHIGCCLKKCLSYLNSNKLELISGKNSSKLTIACMIKVKTIEKNTNYLTDLICVVN